MKLLSLDANDIMCSVMHSVDVRGVNVSKEDDYGFTALHHAATNGIQYLNQPFPPYGLNIFFHVSQVIFPLLNFWCLEMPMSMRLDVVVLRCTALVLADIPQLSSNCFLTL
jgi:hypothetical protein